jgi:hypothetical protein
MSKPGSVQQPVTTRVINNLVQIGELDPLFRDLYLERARGLMASIMSLDGYRNAKESIASLELVERQLRAAVQRSDWERVAELTERVRIIKQSAERTDAMELAEAVYDSLAKIPIDPFAPGFHAFYGSSAKTLSEWRSRAVDILGWLGKADPSENSLYSRRHSDFQSLKITVQAEEKKTEAVSEVDLRREALNALDAGDLAQLNSVVKKLMEKPEEKKADGATAHTPLTESAELGEDLNFAFSGSTLAAAQQLGLAPSRTKSRRHFAYLIPYGWHPSFLKGEGKKWAKDQVAHLTHPAETTDHAMEAIELYLFNPFINSGGTRYQVCMVAEDLLIEDFNEPKPKTELPRTELLTELGLKSRWGLTRIDIENALLMNGPRILRERLQLEPEAFRLVAIPPDVYTVLGADRGWGQQEMWTHFDGYWVREGGELQALAGGDKRFGGTHDVVSFSPDYTSDKVLARFAVVQRKRMKSWQKI